MVRKLRLQSPGAIYHVMGRAWLAVRLEMGVPTHGAHRCTDKTERNQPMQMRCAEPFFSYSMKGAGLRVAARGS
jgi:hypothetical protein